MVNFWVYKKRFPLSSPVCGTLFRLFSLNFLNYWFYVWSNTNVMIMSKKPNFAPERRWYCFLFGFCILSAATQLYSFIGRLPLEELENIIITDYRWFVSFKFIVLLGWDWFGNFTFSVQVQILIVYRHRN